MPDPQNHGMLLIFLGYRVEAILTYARRWVLFYPGRFIPTN
jgi:hypothetical protein